MTTARLLLGILAGSAGLLSAQEAREFGLSAWLPAPVSVPASTVQLSCAALPHRVAFVAAPIHTACEVVRYAGLGRAAGAGWSYALYRHTSVYRFPDRLQPDTVSELELVLFTAPPRGAGRLTAIAHTRQDYSGIADMAMTLATHPAGALLGVEFCVNGTGGCWQEFLHRGGATWRELADPRELVAAELQQTGVLTGPSGPRLATVHLDTRSLAGRAALYNPDDPNCCPSRRVDFQLALTRRGFQLLGLAVVPDPG